MKYNDKEKLLRLPHKLFDTINQEAQEQHMPLNSLIILILTQYLRTQDEISNNHKGTRNENR